MEPLIGIALLIFAAWFVLGGRGDGDGRKRHALASHTDRTEKAENARDRRVREGEDTQRRIAEREAEAARARATRAAERARRIAERDDGAWS